MTLAALGFASQTQRLREASLERERSSRLLEQVFAERDLAARRALQRRTATVPTSNREEGAFLNEFRQKASGAGVHILKWSAQETPVIAEDDTNVDPALKQVTTIRSNVTVEGSYANLRTFVRELVASERLTTINNVSWTRGVTGSQLTCTLSRYLRPAQTTVSTDKPQTVTLR